MSDLIEVINLTKTYRTGSLDFTALKSVNLRVEEGEFIGIVGRSGSGKSTLLYQMSLLDQPTEGEVRYRGCSMARLGQEGCSRFRLGNLGYVFQDYALLPELTSIENVILPLLMSGASRKQAAKRAETALSQVGLASKLANRPSQLSGGEKQRVSIARAIANEPSVIFADEPTANLDTATAETVMRAFKDLHAQGQTVIMVTHELEYRSIFDRVVELSDGQIVSGG